MPKDHVEHVGLAGGVRAVCRLTGSGEQCLVVPFGQYVEEDWERLESGRRVVYLHPRGRGASDHEPDVSRLTVQQWVEDMETVRRHLGFERIVLCGWSNGGFCAALYAVTYPAAVEKLVLIGAVGPRRIRYDGTEASEAKGTTRIDQDARVHLEALSKHGAEDSDPEGFSRQWMRVLMSYQMVNYAAASGMRSDPLRHRNEWRNTMRANAEVMAKSMERIDFERISIAAPTLVIHGDGDVIPLTAAEDWLRYADVGSLAVIPLAGHWPWLEQPEAFFPALRAFLDRTS